MNERIKQLADQAGATVLTTHGMEHVVDGCYVIGPARLEKFAELIVKECIDIAQDRANFPGFPPNDVNDIIDEIREHFGVEE